MLRGEVRKSYFSKFVDSLNSLSTGVAENDKAFKFQVSLKKNRWTNQNNFHNICKTLIKVLLLYQMHTIIA